MIRLKEDARIWAIGDLHLPGGGIKPMDIFGPQWKDHFERIKEDWRSKVSPGDVVLIPGDISWAMRLSEALPDLLEIASLPGQTVLLKGNHDYWWSSVTRIRASLPGNMAVLQNDAVSAGTCVFCGTRGWIIPGMCVERDGEQDVKIYRREAGRLELSLRQAQRIGGKLPLIALMHYPPILPGYFAEGTEFTRLLTQYGVRRCVYGHLHGSAVRQGMHGVYGGVRYDLVSCDALDFRLMEVSLNL